jgi:ATP-dependent DNA helicase 2 subunit 1
MNGNKRVFLVTDNDEPPGSSSTRQAARTTFGVSRLSISVCIWPNWQDLDTYGITINTFFVDRPNHRFNPTIYWNVGRPTSAIAKR